MKYKTFKKKIDDLAGQIKKLENETNLTLLDRIRRYDDAIGKLSGSMEYENLAITTSDPYTGESHVERYIPLSPDLIQALVKALEKDKRKAIREWEEDEDLPF